MLALELAGLRLITPTSVKTFGFCSTSTFPLWSSNDEHGTTTRGSFVSGDHFPTAGQFGAWSADRRAMQLAQRLRRGARVSLEDFGYDALPARWRERATYGSACLALTFRQAEARTQLQAPEGSPRYFLRTDAGRIERIGCYDAYERRYALVDRWGRRAL